jgi:hypothetical protein
MVATNDVQIKIDIGFEIVFILDCKPGLFILNLMLNLILLNLILSCRVLKKNILSWSDRKQISEEPAAY